MATVYDNIDIRSTTFIDLLIEGENIEAGIIGDISSTMPDPIKGLIQLIDIWMIYSPGELRDFPNIGLDLDRFIGEHNTEALGNQIQKTILDGLSGAGIVRREDLEVEVIPIDIYSILIVLKISAAATPQNSLEQVQVIVSYLFDSTEIGIQPFNLDGSTGTGD